MIPNQKKEREWNDPPIPGETPKRSYKLGRLILFIIVGFAISAIFFYILNGGKF